MIFKKVNEKFAEEIQFKKRWVQSTSLTNKIGRNARVRDSLSLSITKTRNSFKTKPMVAKVPGPASRQSRQASNSFTVDDLLADIHADCKMGVLVNAGFSSSKIFSYFNKKDQTYII